MAVLGILSGCQSLRDLERYSCGEVFAFDIRHHSALDRGIGALAAATAIGLVPVAPPRWPAASRYFFLQVEVTAICSAIRDWTIAQIPGGAADLDQLVCDGKTLRGSIVPTAGGRSAYGLRETGSTLPESRSTSPLWAWQSARPATPSVKTTSGQFSKQLLGELDLEGVLSQADALHTQKPFFGSFRSRGRISC